MTTADAILTRLRAGPATTGEICEAADANVTAVQVAIFRLRERGYGIDVVPHYRLEHEPRQRVRCGEPDCLAWLAQDAIRMGLRFCSIHQTAHDLADFQRNLLGYECHPDSRETLEVAP
jgi:biotin operon repressor